VPTPAARAMWVFPVEKIQKKFERLGTIKEKSSYMAKPPPFAALAAAGGVTAAPRKTHSVAPSFATQSRNKDLKRVGESSV
jgi:hypothetical protein